MADQGVLDGGGSGVPGGSAQVEGFEADHGVLDGVSGVGGWTHDADDPLPAPAPLPLVC